MSFISSTVSHETWVTSAYFNYSLTEAIATPLDFAQKNLKQMSVFFRCLSWNTFLLRSFSFVLHSITSNILHSNLISEAIRKVNAIVSS